MTVRNDRKKEFDSRPSQIVFAFLLLSGVLTLVIGNVKIGFSD